MRWIGLFVGVVAVLVGLTWTMQGLNILRGSFMSGQTMWAIIGPIVGIVGLVLVIFGIRARSS